MKRFTMCLAIALVSGCSDHPVYKNITDDAYSFCKDRGGLRYIQMEPFLSPHPSKMFKIVCQNGEVTWAGSEVRK